MQRRMSIRWMLNENDEEPVTAGVGRPSYPQAASSQDGERQLSDDQEQRGRRDESHLPGPETHAFSGSNGQISTYPPHDVRESRSSSSSDASISTTRPNHPRAPRPKYSLEEDHFIWYQRIDLNKDWREVGQAFNEHFWPRTRGGESGLQCRFYRILGHAGIPGVRSLRNNDDNQQLFEYGLVRYTDYRYNWMLPVHQA